MAHWMDQIQIPSKKAITYVYVNVNPVENITPSFLTSDTSNCFCSSTHCQPSSKMVMSGTTHIMHSAHLLRQILREKLEGVPSEINKSRWTKPSRLLTCKKFQFQHRPTKRSMLGKNFHPIARAWPYLLHHPS